MSSVSRSTIGTPVLTSTTNARVAGIESVECSDVLLPDYSSKKAGSVQMSTNTDSSSPQPQHDIDKSNPWAVTVRSVKKKLSHSRRASASLLLDGPLTRRNARGKGHAATPSVGSSRMLGSVTTYKDKLHHWTGRDPRPQVEMRSDASLSQSLSRSKASTANVHSADTGENEQRVPRLPCLYTESTTNLLATSLSRSFASAVEKIDFDSSPTLVSHNTPTSRLKKARSLWSLNRLVRDVSGRSLETGQSSTQLSSVDPSSTASGSHVSKISSAANGRLKLQAGPDARALSKPRPLRWSARKNRWIKPKPPPRANQHVDPLRVHPGVTSFVTPSQRVNTPITPGQAHPRSQQADNDDQDGSARIDRAVIYSPSTGDLSVYSRTPSPTALEAQLAARKERQLQETPTRKPLHKSSGSILRKSVSTFFGRSTSIIKFSGFSPIKRSKTEQNIATTSDRMSWSHGLSLKYKGIAIDRPRERSMSTPVLSSTDGVRAVWDYQPTTPSPLRKSTKVSTTPGGRQRALTTTTPIRMPTEDMASRIPRSQAPSLGPEKRYARYIRHSAENTICP
ncbi:hypothetical protein LTS08_001932 [Lithohypha guttulata]|nr:hypothetical protein LTS08_001932 [Lithohypha guttulata]